MREYRMLVYSIDYNNNSHPDDDSPYWEDAVDFARGMVWAEVECSEQTISHREHIQDVNGVGVWYCYGTDSFFFTDETTGD